MTRPKTAYEAFETTSTQHRRLLQQERLILEVTEALSEALAHERLTKADLAAGLGKSKGFVSQILAGDRNLTLRTIADVADALGYEIHIEAMKKGSHQKIAVEPGIVASEPRTIAWTPHRAAGIKVKGGASVQPSVSSSISEAESVAA